MTKLYARVSNEFHPKYKIGVLVAAENINATYNFTELGYDTVDFEDPPKVLEVDGRGTNYASNYDVACIVESINEMSSDLAMSEELRELVGELNFFMDVNRAELCPNEAIQSPAVRAELRARGFDAFKGTITEMREKHKCEIYWIKETFEATETTDYTFSDEDNHVLIVNNPSPSMNR